MKDKFSSQAWLARFRQLGSVTLVAFMLLLTATPQAHAGVSTNGLFELDANPQDDNTVPGDDWGTPPDAGGALKFSGIIPDAAPKSIFDGGKKDIQDINQWSWKDGAVPDKDDLTNAYAAAYTDNGDLVLYFGADRYSNVGDAFMGFWFFKQKVGAQPSGSFSGLHTPGDTLVLVDFPQASNAVPYIAVVTWDPTCSKATSNTPTPGQCAATNLRLKSEGSGNSGAVCGGGGASLACAITNHGDVPAPWSYTPKAGTPGVFPYESFFEGGINISKLVGGNDNCFSSFMAETRSSSSFTASLKDFVLGDFELCGIKISKNCTAGEVNNSETGFVYTFDGTVTNTGFGTLYDVKIVDDNGTPLDTSDDFIINIDPIAKGAVANYSGTFNSTLNPPTNGVMVSAASTAGGAATITDKTTALCPGVNRDPAINVSKACTTKVLALNGLLTLKVDYAGQVCNGTGGSSGLAPIALKNVFVQDDAGTPLDPTDDPAPIPIGSLAADTCVPYSGSYTPASANSTTPGEISFSDSVTATGVAVLNFGPVEDSATATCRLCPTCPTCPPTN